MRALELEPVFVTRSPTLLDQSAIPPGSSPSIWTILHCAGLRISYGEHLWWEVL